MGYPGGMALFSVAEAQARLSELVARGAGEEVIIVPDNGPAVWMRVVTDKQPTRGEDGR